MIDHTSKYVFIRNGREYIKIHYKDILWVQADGNYSKIVTKDKPFVLRVVLKDLANNFPNFFFRPHKSYLVNINNVVSFNSTSIRFEQGLIPVARDSFSELLKAVKTI